MSRVFNPGLETNQRGTASIRAPNPRKSAMVKSGQRRIGKALQARDPESMRPSASTEAAQVEEILSAIAENDLTTTPWTFFCIAELLNYASLRRQLGLGRAEHLVEDVSALIRQAVPGARLSKLSCAQVQFEFGASCRGDLDTVLGQLQTIFQSSSPVGEPGQFEVLFAAASCPSGLTDPLTLVEEVEQAITDARTQRRTVIRDVSAGVPTYDRLSLLRDLTNALPRNEMFVQYQPKLHLRHQRIDGAEALLRWQHPTRGLIPPSDFIPAAEETHQIAALTLWTLERVIEDQQALAAQGHELVMFVNISGLLLSDTPFVARACQMIRASNAKIGFEITETAVIRDPETAIAHLQIFADMGITIAIDDYGAGLSSLAYLKQLPARELKIDKMFVMQLTSSNRDPLIVRSTIDLAHAMEMEVTAEGVETQAALALLGVMGCDMVQGFLISRPMSFDALEHFIREESHAAATIDPRAAFNRPSSFWKSSAGSSG